MHPWARMDATEFRSAAQTKAAPPAGRALSVRSERGFTLIEVLAAVALISIGVASTLRIFGGSGRTVLRAERTEVAIHQAQAELDRLRTLPYGALAMTAQPPYSSDVRDPGSRVQGTSFQVRPGLVEPLVLTSAPGQTSAVDT